MLMLICPLHDKGGDFSVTNLNSSGPKPGHRPELLVPSENWHSPQHPKFNRIQTVAVMELSGKVKVQRVEGGVCVLSVTARNSAELF